MQVFCFSYKTNSSNSNNKQNHSISVALHFSASFLFLFLFSGLYMFKCLCLPIWLFHISNIEFDFAGNLRNMAIDMGSELENQNTQIDRINRKVRVYSMSNIGQTNNAIQCSELSNFRMNRLRLSPKFYRNRTFIVGYVTTSLLSALKRVVSVFLFR